MCNGHDTNCECNGSCHKTKCGEPGFTKDSIVCAGCNGNCFPPKSIKEHQEFFKNAITGAQRVILELPAGAGKSGSQAGK